MDKVTKCGATGCWIWTAFVNPDGYGMVSVRGKSIRAHRHAYQLFVGPIPSGKQLDHLCRVRGCVNPSHLEPVSGVENWRRGESVTRQLSFRDKCKNGHELSGSNVRMYKGIRRCQICQLSYVHKYRRKKRDRLTAKFK